MLGSDMRKASSYNRSYGNRTAHNSFYHVHYYIYPLIYWLELITDFGCLKESTFDVAYMSEYDVTWNDEKLQSLLNPESILFGNMPAQAACGLDCGAATFNLPDDSMFWCSGCWATCIRLAVQIRIILVESRIAHYLIPGYWPRCTG